ncbi:MAG: aminotransferase class I/II-fold pyridoxal phosphate-dependent enzyme [Candidatus Dormibacteria bacterium]
MDVRQLVTGGRASEIGASLERVIRDGEVGTGERLPTVRDLALSLGVSANTVAAAYRGLQARGLVSSDGRRGTIVSRRPPLVTRPRAEVPRGARDLAAGNPDPGLLPRVEPFLAGLRAEPPHLYGGQTNRPELLELAGAAFAADGIDAGHLAVVGGALDGVERVLMAHLHPGDRVALEDPGYPGILDLVGALGLHAEPIALDDDGPLTADLERALASGVEACIVTPRAQNPMGSAIGATRAAELRAVLAHHPGVLLVEDDHAGSVSGAGPISLTAGRERWAVARSVAKSLGPDLRLGVLAGDQVTIARVEGRQRLGAGWVSHVLQRLVVALYRDGSVRTLQQRATLEYVARREAMVAALAAEGIVAHGRSGFNVWVEVAEEAPVLRHLLAHGFVVAPGEPFRLRSRPAIRVSIGNLAVSDAPRLAGLVAASLAPGARARTA